jgi:hypothetical protein
MSRAELDILPDCAGFQAVQRSHVNQHAQRSMLPDKPLEFGHKALVVCFHQLPADLNDNNFSTVLLIELNRHFESPFDSTSGRLFIRDSSNRDDQQDYHEHPDQRPDPHPSAHPATGPMVCTIHHKKVLS